MGLADVIGHILGMRVVAGGKQRLRFRYLAGDRGAAALAALDHIQRLLELAGAVMGAGLVV